MADAPAKDAGTSTHPAKSTKKVSFSGKAVKMGAGAEEAPKWKKKEQKLFSVLTTCRRRPVTMCQPPCHHLFREPAL
jgi:hypothetical protein